MWDWSPIRDWLSGVITPYWTSPLLLAVQTLMIMICLILTMAFYTLAERKVIGWIQARKGPNRIGGLLVPGLAQPFADVVKLMFKEIIIPADSNGFLFRLAPFLAMVPSLAIWAVRATCLKPSDDSSEWRPAVVGGAQESTVTPYVSGVSGIC